MARDFRANQIQTRKLIASGTTGTGAKMLVYDYSADGSPPNQGNINALAFDTSNIGTDIFLYVSGSVYSKDEADSHGVAVFGGDVHVSGNLTSDYIAFADADWTDWGNSIQTTSSVAIAKKSIANLGSDLHFYVSGGISDKYSVFGGTVRISGNLYVSGTDPSQGGWEAQILAQRGSETKPAYSFVPSTNTGMHSALSNTVGITSNGINRLLVGDNTGKGTDVNFYVSGSKGGIGTSGVSVFGGDVHISGSLVVSGGLGAQILAEEGSQTVPGYAFAGSTNYGMYKSGATLLFTTAGTAKFQCTATTNRAYVKIVNVDGTELLPSYTYTNDSDTGEWLAGTDTLGLVASGSNRVLIGNNTGKGSDVSFWVSGSIGGIGSSGVSVFGGPLVVSGAINSIGPLRGLGGLIIHPGSPTAVTSSQGIDQIMWVSGTTAVGAAGNSVATFGGSVVISGNLYVSGSPAVQILPGIGTAAAPMYSFKGFTNYGMYQTGTSLGWSTAGVSRSTLSATAFAITVPASFRTGSAGALAAYFTGDTDTGIHSQLADTFAITTTGINRVVVGTSAGTASQTQGGVGTDVRFFVSGSKGGKGTSGVSVFNGDTVVSGTLYAEQGLSGSLTRLTNGSSYLLAGTNITLATGSTGQVTINSTGGGASTTWIDEGNALWTTASVQIGISGAIASSRGSDINFYVSGSKGGIGTSGVSVFNGDVQISGSLVVSGGSGARILAEDGLSGTPAFAFKDAPAYGMYKSGDTILFSGGGSPRFQITNTTVKSFNPVNVPDGTAALPAYTFTNETDTLDTGFYRVAEDTIGVATSGSNRIITGTTTGVTNVTTWISGALAVDIGSQGSGSQNKRILVDGDTVISGGLEVRRVLDVGFSNDGFGVTLPNGCIRFYPVATQGGEPAPTFVYGGTLLWCGTDGELYGGNNAYPVQLTTGSVQGLNLAYRIDPLCYVDDLWGPIVLQKYSDTTGYSPILELSSSIDALTAPGLTMYFGATNTGRAIDIDYRSSGQAFRISKDDGSGNKYDKLVVAGEQVLIPSGTLAFPGLSFVSGTSGRVANTGLFLSHSLEMNMVVSGVKTYAFTPNCRELVMSGSTTDATPALLWTYAIASGTLYDMDVTVLAKGGTLQKRFKRNLALYNTGTTTIALEDTVFVPIPDVTGSANASALDISFLTGSANVSLYVTGSSAESLSWVSKVKITID